MWYVYLSTMRVQSHVNVCVLLGVYACVGVSYGTADRVMHCYSETEGPNPTGIEREQRRM